jgi:hypothetical protein
MQQGIGESVIKKTARITSKGQITVPQEIRRCGFAPAIYCSSRETQEGFASCPCEPKAHLKNIAASGPPGIAHGKKAVVKWVRRLRGR